MNPCLRRAAGSTVVGLSVLLVVLSGCASVAPRNSPSTLATATAPRQTTLVVALYPYVPRIDQFEKAIAAAWSKAHPDIALSFLSANDWDGGYAIDPPANADVFVFDAVFLDFFRSRGWLEPMSAREIVDLGDFVPYAIAGVEQGGQYYAIPQLGCANILFYQQSDSALAEAETLTEVKNALSECTYSSKIPPDRRGLMIDMSGGSTNACLYLDIAHSLTGQFPLPLPPSLAEVNPTAMSNMRLLLALASYPNGTSGMSVPYEQATWFSQGWGRALIGYTESMSAMSDETLAGIGFKVMPFSDNDQQALFYADVIGVNPTSRQRSTRDLAVELANIMAASSTMVASIGPDGGKSPQFLMAARPSVFDTLGRSFPIYSRMYDLIAANRPIMFGLNEQSRAWFAAMKNPIRGDARKDYPCHCDYPATQPIPDNSAAPAICDSTCASRGGWAGTWTNQYPAAPTGSSVCGCNACPVP